MLGLDLKADGTRENKVKDSEERMARKVLDLGWEGKDGNVRISRKGLIGKKERTARMAKKRWQGKDSKERAARKERTGWRGKDSEERNDFHIRS